MSDADRRSFALRVALYTLLFCGSLGGTWILMIGVASEHEPARLAFWTAMLTLFNPFIAAATADVAGFPRPAALIAAFLVGAASGLVFAALALTRSGLSAREIETPLFLLWTMGSGLAFLIAVLPRYESLRYVGGGATASLGTTSMLLAFLVVLGIKYGLDRVGAPLDFARRPPAPAPLHDVVKPQAICQDTLRWNELNVLTDSSVVLQPAGVYGNLQRDSSGVYTGTVMRLWTGGTGVFGVWENWTGEGEPTIAPIHVLEHDPAAGSLRFLARYQDGYVDEVSAQWSSEAITATWDRSPRGCAGFRKRVASTTLLLDAAEAAQQGALTLRELR